MINDKDSHIPLPPIMFTCAVLHHALLQWQKNKGVHLNPSKAKFKPDRPDRSNVFNSKTHGGKNTSCSAAMGHMWLTSPGVADNYTLLMIMLNTLQESYQQMVYTTTLATVKRQIQQRQTPTPAVVIRVDAARVNNVTLLDYLTSKVALEEPEIGSLDATSR